MPCPANPLKLPVCVRTVLQLPRAGTLTVISVNSRSGCNIRGIAGRRSRRGVRVRLRVREGRRRVNRECTSRLDRCGESWLADHKETGRDRLYAIVQYDFAAERPDELNARAGEPIIVIAQSNHEW
jgi:hypothetical protein